MENEGRKEIKFHVIQLLINSKWDQKNLIDNKITCFCKPWIDTDAGLKSKSQGAQKTILCFMDLSLSLHHYLLIYLLTYLLHGAQSF